MEMLQRVMLRVIVVLIMVLMIAEGAEQVYAEFFPNDCMTDSECEGVE